MQAAAATLAGNAVGAEDKITLKKITKQFLIIEVILMIISGGLLFITSPYIVGLFTADSSVKTLGITVLRMVAISEPFFGVAIIIEGILQGMGKTMEPFIYNIIGMWGIRILGTFICTQFFSLGLVSAWGCMIAHNLFLCLMFFVFSKGKIMKEKAE
jgi:Na+-driven multidrug efflux pump